MSVDLVLVKLRHQPTNIKFLASLEVIILWQIIFKANILVQDEIEENCDHGTSDSICSIQPIWDIIETRVSSKELEDEQLNAKDHWLEHVPHYQIRCLKSEGTPVPKFEATYVFILCNCVVAEGSSLITFVTLNSKPYMSTLNHVNIVATISHTGCNRVSKDLLFPYKGNNLSFLSRRWSKYNNGFDGVENGSEHANALRVLPYGR